MSAWNELDDAASCYYCGTTDQEMRPYGPGGDDVCHPCATASPEREAQTKAAFSAQFAAAAAASPLGVVVIGDGAPQPMSE